MGAMKEIAIMMDSLELDKFYNVEYVDDDVIVKKQRIKYIGKHKDLVDGIEKLVFQQGYPHDLIINPCMLIDVEESHLIRNDIPEPLQLKRKSNNNTRWKKSFLDDLENNKYPLQVKTKIKDVVIQFPVVYGGHCYVEELGIDTLSFTGMLNGSVVYVHITPEDIESNNQEILIGTAKDEYFVYEEHVSAYFLNNSDGYEWNTDELIVGNAYQLVSKEDDKRVNTLLADIDSSWLRFLTAEKQNTMLPSFGQVFININRDADSGWDVYALELRT